MLIRASPISLSLEIKHRTLTAGVVRRLRVHHVQSGRDIVALTFSCEDDVTLVVSATVRVDDLRIGCVDYCHWCSLKGSVTDLLCISKRNLLDDGRLVQTSARGRSTSILDKEDLIAGRVPKSRLARIICQTCSMLNLPCNSLVEDWVRFRGRDLSQGRVGSNNIIELLVVDVKRLR